MPVRRLGPGFLRRREAGPAGPGPLPVPAVHLRGDLALELLHAPLRRGSRLRAGLLKVRRRRFRHRRLGRDVGPGVARLPMCSPEGRGGSLRLRSRRGHSRGWRAHVTVERSQESGLRRCRWRRGSRRRCRAAIAASSRQEVDAEVVPPAPPPLPKPPAPVSAPLRPPASPPPPPRNPVLAGVMSPRSKSVGSGLPPKVTTSSSTMVGAGDRSPS